jgi:hypothetical protein
MRPLPGFTRSRTPPLGRSGHPCRDRGGRNAVALHAGSDDGHGGPACVALRFIALARPPEAAVLRGRPGPRARVGAQGCSSPGPTCCADARRVFPTGWIGRSVHSVAGRSSPPMRRGPAGAGNIYETLTHPDRSGIGLAPLRESVARHPGDRYRRSHFDRAAARDAGAWGVAALRAPGGLLIRTPPRSPCSNRGVSR